MNPFGLYEELWRVLFAPVFGPVSPLMFWNKFAVDGMAGLRPLTHGTGFAYARAVEEEDRRECIAAGDHD